MGLKVGDTVRVLGDTFYSENVAKVAKVYDSGMVKLDDDGITISFNQNNLELIESAEPEDEVYVVIWRAATDKPYEATVETSGVFEDNDAANQFITDETEELERASFNVWFTKTRRPRKVSVLVEKKLQITEG